VRILPLLACILAGPLLWPVSAHAAAPSYSLEERAAAIASPALVFVDVRFTGVMRIKNTGIAIDTQPIVIHNRCSGFAVSGLGHVVTSTPCVKPTGDSLRPTAAVMATNDLIRDKKLAAEQKDAYIKELLSTADFTDADGVAPPKPKILGQLFTADGDADEAGMMTGKLIGTSAGSLALLKFAQTTPVVDLESDGLDGGTVVTQVGYGTRDANVEKATFVARLKQSKIVGRQAKDSPQLKIDSELGKFAHGGMVLNTRGQVVGMINTDLSAKERANDLVSGSAEIAAMLEAFGVSNVLQPIDLTYREGLDAYFGGRYRAAIGKFDQVLAAMPKHEIAGRYRAMAEERLNVEGEASGGMPIWQVIGLSSLATAVLVGLLFGLRGPLARRRRSRSLTARRGPEPVRIAGPVSPEPSDPEPVRIAGPVAPEPSDPEPGVPVHGGSDPSPWAPPPDADAQPPE
jgi:hypothetical protein